MGTSSNFGSVFSAAGASLFLSFLPMLPSIGRFMVFFGADQLDLGLPHLRRDALGLPCPRAAVSQRLVCGVAGHQSLVVFV
ncbi:MAG TPA: hypothetical protein VMU73_06015, partial [Gaiellaceae bacterium]|nr:hypothetical protein [Gaiellaceae bacterium]